MSSQAQKPHDVVPPAVKPHPHDPHTHDAHPPPTHSSVPGHHAPDAKHDPAAAAHAAQIFSGMFDGPIVPPDYTKSGVDAYCFPENKLPTAHGEVCDMMGDRQGLRYDQYVVHTGDGDVNAAAESERRIMNHLLKR